MKVIVNIKGKGLLKGLGLHHAGVMLAAIAITHFFGFGYETAVFVAGGYAFKEWGWDIRPPITFEIMDFLSPALVSGAYMYWIN